MIGRCEATIRIADESGDNHRDFRCQQWPGHKGRHNHSGKQPLTVIDQMQGVEPLVFSVTWRDTNAPSPAARGE